MKAGELLNRALRPAGYEIRRLHRPVGSAPQPLPKVPLPDGQIAVLFNDTDALEGFCHFGCAVVTRAILSALAERGVTVAATINGPEALIAFEREFPEARLGLVVVNGEGTMHSGNRDRARWLLQSAGTLAEHHGCPAALINSIWAMPAAEARLLDRFEHIFLRETASQHRLAEAGVGSKVVADLSVTSFADTPTPSGTGIVVLDSVIDPLADRLVTLAQVWGVPAYCCSLHNKTRWHARPYRAGVPPLFEPSCGLQGRLLTGRFHGMCLAVSIGAPFVVIPSNTAKSEAMLDDIGLAFNPVLDADRLSDDAEAVLIAVERLFAAWDDAEGHAALARYVKKARTDTEVMFDQITGRSVA